MVMLFNDIENFVSNDEMLGVKFEMIGIVNLVKCKWLLLIFVMVVIVLVVGYLFYDWLIVLKCVIIDNVYVVVEIVQVMLLVGGQVIDVMVSNMQVVKVGQILMWFDDVDIQIVVV